MFVRNAHTAEATLAEPAFERTDAPAKSRATASTFAERARRPRPVVRTHVLKPSLPPVLISLGVTEHVFQSGAEAQVVEVEIYVDKQHTGRRYVRTLPGMNIEPAFDTTPRDTVTKLKPLKPGHALGKPAGVYDTSRVASPPILDTQPPIPARRNRQREYVATGM